MGSVRVKLSSASQQLVAYITSRVLTFRHLQISVHFSPMGSKAPAHHKPLPNSLASRDVGIWRVIYENPAYLGRSWLQEIQDRIQAIREAPILRLLHDVYALDAKLTIITAASRCIKGLEDALSIYLSARLLALVRAHLRFCPRRS